MDDQSPEAVAPVVGGDSAVARMAERIYAQMRKAIVGQDELLESLVVAALSSGHVLLEGVPGTAKTLAVRAFARACDASFARVQFTPDLMPSDIIGTNIYDQGAGEFRLRKGPLFAGIVLADEINRTPPKTQSALLEAMEERAATIDGTRYPLPEPFLVCATQNPIEFEGTYPLPEAQLDRFMLKVLVDYPDAEGEQQILSRYEDGFRASDLDQAGIEAVASAEQMRILREQVARTAVSPSVRKYIVDISRSARSNRHLMLGPSPRAGISLMLASKARAAIRDRDYVTPDDVKDLAYPVLRHRLLLKPESEIEGYTPDRVLSAVLETVEVPR